jgi:hypothetical protein
MSATLDDLEAAQLRAGELERELAELHKRSATLAAELEGDDTAEDLASARRLAAAKKELEARAASERAIAEVRARHRRYFEGTPRERMAAVLVIVVSGVALIGGTLSLHLYPVAVLMMIVHGTLLGALIPQRGASSKAIGDRPTRGLLPAAYRDDLGAAQLRVADLQREVDEIRERNATLEAKLAAGDTNEQLAEARRLAAVEEWLKTP